MKKIVILDGKTLGEVDYKRLKEFGEIEYYGITKDEEVRERVKNANIIITNKVALTKESLSEAKELEIICEAATGFNNIDINYAKENNIAVTNVAGYSTSSVAQHTFATALSLIEKLSFYDNFVKSGQYAVSGQFTSLEKSFFEIEGKTWGIIGLGNIGKKVAKIAEAFGAKIVYYSTSGRNSDSHFERVDFEELLKVSDIISIHSPLNEKTLGLIDYEALSKMKKESILVNMGRGPIVVEKDLAKAIDEELIGGAALDVFEVEPISRDSVLTKVKNKERLVLTPHIGWASVESRERLFDVVIENIKSFYRGEIRNRVEI